MPINASHRFFRSITSGITRVWNGRFLKGARSRPHLRLTQRLPELVDQTRLQWADDARIRIEADPELVVGSDGVWMRAWLLAGGVAHISPEARERAVARLPVMCREIYRLWQAGLDFSEIGVRLGIGSEEVKQLLSQALLFMDHVLQSD